jgi:hypothetical protein
LEDLGRDRSVNPIKVGEIVTTIIPQKGSILNQLIIDFSLKLLTLMFILDEMLGF